MLVYSLCLRFGRSDNRYMSVILIYGGEGERLAPRPRAWTTVEEPPKAPACLCRSCPLWCRLLRHELEIGNRDLVVPLDQKSELALGEIAARLDKGIEHFPLVANAHLLHQ